ncbi:MAG: helix-turn-helix transcriptional regulator [Legionella sp.]|nr:helix-turn-helix transcriptional regulator [Legionella sp.]
MIKIKNDVPKISAGRRIKMARTLAGLSRKDLEEKYGISMHTLQSWELGRNPLTDKAASKLIEIFHNIGVSCSLQWLMEGSGKSPALVESEFTPYPLLDKDIAPLLDKEITIQKEIDFFRTNNPNASVIMVTDDSMEPRYAPGDFVGGTQYLIPQKINECIGHDCIVETNEGTFFRRLMRRKNGYTLVCLNPQTETEEPVIFTKHILAATPIIWHRWKFKKPE